MSKINLNDDVAIDLATLIDTRLLVQANSGGGKSWLLRRILEQSHGNVQQIIIDLEGEFSTLREKYDYILAAKEGDTAAEPRSAALLARRLLELNVSAIVDLYELNHQERRRFVRLFLTAMINAPKELWHPCLIIIDEAHVFAPQTGQSEAMESVIDLATRGRKRGYCAVLATQRISKLHKDAVAEMNNKLIGRTGLDIDRKRAAEELGFTSKEDALSLRNLAPGEFYAFGPALFEAVEKMVVGPVETKHPKAGARIITETTPPTDKIRAVIAKLADLPQEARKEAQTLDDLQRENTTLKRKVTTLERQNSAPARATAETKTEIKTVVDDKQTKALQKIVDLAQGVLQPSAIQPTTLPPIIARPMVMPSQESAKEGGPTRIMRVLASRYPMAFTKTQLALLANLSPKSGSYGTYLSQLKSQGLIDGTNEIGLTEAGIEATAHIEKRPATQEELLGMWANNLNGGARRMFDVLTGAYPKPISKEELGYLTEMSPRSGTFGTYLSQLKTRLLITVDGQQIKASGNLFLEEDN